MLPIKRAHLNHLHDIRIRYATTAEYDILLLRVLSAIRFRFTGEHLTPLASIGGNRATKHWVFRDDQGQYFYVAYNWMLSTTKARTSHPNVEALIEALPDKDTKGAAVKKHLVRQLQGEVAYGVFPHKALPVPTPAVAEPPRLLAREGLDRILNLRINEDDNDT
jgi:hypothetical protein